MNGGALLFRWARAPGPHWSLPELRVADPINFSVRYLGLVGHDLASLDGSPYATSI